MTANKEETSNASGGLSLGNGVSGNTFSVPSTSGSTVVNVKAGKGASAQFNLKGALHKYPSLRNL